MSLLTNASTALEVGPIYLREQGQLHLLNGASSVKVTTGKPKSARLFQKGFTVNLCIEDGDKPSSCRTDHIVFTYTKAGNLRYSPKSLFDVVLAFIADNIQHVDSLIGFPEQIAEKLFTAVEARKTFIDRSTSTMALFTFSKAYGSLVLQSLCLRERVTLASERLKEIQSFRGLKCLDLSSCRLGDDHELLRHLTSESLMSLTTLYLGDNGLSDCGLQKMTAPVRVMRRGLGNLEVLDLSGNPRISKRGMQYVCCFSKLRALNISGTGVTANCSSIQMIQSKLSLFPAGEPLEEFQHSCCKTDGWAEQVVYQWERLCERQHEKVGCRTVAQRFLQYYLMQETTDAGILSKNKVLEELSVASVEYVSDGVNKFINLDADGFSNTVQIKDPVRLEFHRKPNQDLPVQSPMNSTIGSSKRGADQAKEIGCSSPPAKCKRGELSLDDWDVLNCY